MSPSFMASSILFEWCRILANEIENHPKRKVPVKILRTSNEIHQWVAQKMVEEVKQNNSNGKPTRWILPYGPIGQYRYFMKSVIQQRISLRNLHIFHMDNYLDWQGRPLPIDHPFTIAAACRDNPCLPNCCENRRVHPERASSISLAQFTGLLTMVTSL